MAPNVLKLVALQVQIDWKSMFRGNENEARAVSYVDLVRECAQLRYLCVSFHEEGHSIYVNALKRKRGFSPSVWPPNRGQLEIVVPNGYSYGTGSYLNPSEFIVGGGVKLLTAADQNELRALRLKEFLKPWKRRPSSSTLA